MAIQSSPRMGFGPRFGIEVVGLVVALAAGVGIGALAFDGGSNDSSSSVTAPVPLPADPPRVSSAPGVGELSEQSLIAAEKAIHDAYMDAHFGPYVKSSPSDSRVPEEPNPDVLPPFSEVPPVQLPDGFDLEAARLQHDELLPVGGN